MGCASASSSLRCWDPWRLIGSERHGRAHPHPLRRPVPLAATAAPGPTAPDAPADCTGSGDTCDSQNRMRMPGTLYELLGVRATASQSELRAGYRAQAAAHHPDVVPGSQRRFQVC
jgi:hypothetical protein